MSHRHFCDAAGHYWECEGMALRPFTGQLEPTPCLCMKHGVPMDDGDHSGCPIELLACPEHAEEACQEHASEEPQPTGDHARFTDKDGRPTVGFCWWCNRDFYSMEEAFEHNHGKNCPELQKAINGTPEDTEMCDLLQLLKSLTLPE